MKATSTPYVTVPCITRLPPYHSARAVPVLPNSRTMGINREEYTAARMAEDRMEPVNWANSAKFCASRLMIFVVVAPLIPSL